MASKFSSSSTNASQIQKNWSTYKPNKKYQSQLRSAEKKQPTYKDAYKGYKNAVVNQLENGSGFEFDTNSPVYQAYSNDYRLLGNIAADASAANIEGLSGGYGTTYSGTVAQQGLESHLQSEKNIIPALYQQERANYQAEQGNLINRGNLYNQLESQDFAQFQDKLNRWNANRDYYYNKFITDYQQSARQHATSSGSETATSVSEASKSKKSKSFSKAMQGIKDYDSAIRKLTKMGYGDQLDDFLTRGEYVHYRAQLDRNYNAGWEGVQEGDEDYKTKKAAEDKIDQDYNKYISNYVKQKVKRK